MFLNLILIDYYFRNDSMQTEGEQEISDITFFKEKSFILKNALITKTKLMIQKSSLFADEFQFGD